MLGRIRQHRYLRTVVITVFAMLWLVAMSSGVRARAMHSAEGHSVNGQVLAAMQQILCGSHSASVATHAQFAAWMAATWGVGDAHAHDSDPVHAEPASPHCLLCLALIEPATWALQVAPHVQPAHLHHWKQPCCFPPALLIRAPLPPRGPPSVFFRA